jgi:ATPase subunit of ABC transporter with duplicated ATPase domains
LSLLNNWVKENNGVIIWCTSDYNDLLFQCRSKWTLTSSSFKNNNKHDARYHNILLNPEGYLNLKIDNLSFGYENGKVIFNNLSININNARCLGLLGNNGSGKTTLAGLCFGDLKSLKGSIELKIGENSNLRIGYLDQFPENLLLLTKLVDFVEKLKKLKLLTPEKIKSIKSKLQMFHISWKKIKYLNSIEMSWIDLRVTLIVILSHCVFHVLILDEPSFGLGWNQRVLLRSFLKESMIDKHFIIVSHDKNFSNSICDKIIDFDKINL